MPSGSQKGAFLQGYNAQAAVDGFAQIVVAADVIQQTTDNAQLQPMLAQVKSNLDALPAAISADSGFWNPDQVLAAETLGANPHVALGKEKQAADAPEPETEACPEAPADIPPEAEVCLDTPPDTPPAVLPATPPDSPPLTKAARRDAIQAATREAMKRKLASEAGRDLYRKRKAIVEPVFGQIKECRGFRRFSLRGLEGAQAEWAIVCAAHNLLKLFRFSFRFQAA
jgi:hypothetical protein